jgi:hypothetical protein
VIVIGEDLFGPLDILGSAFDLYGVGQKINGHIKSVFQQSQVLVPRTEERLNVRGDIDIFFHSAAGNPPCNGAHICLPLANMGFDGNSPPPFGADVGLDTFVAFSCFGVAKTARTSEGLDARHRLKAATIARRVRRDCL